MKNEVILDYKMQCPAVVICEDRYSAPIKLIIYLRT